MRKLVYYIAMSLDGFIAPPSETFEAFIGEGDHVGDYLESLAAFDAVVMGRRTYDIGLRAGVTNPYPALRTYVVSRSLGTSPDPAVTVIAADPIDAVRALKAEPGRAIYLCGGGDLAAQLYAAGLIDEIIIKLHPLLLGRGIRLFGDGGELPGTALAPRDARFYPTGVAVLAYRVAAPAPAPAPARAPA